MTLDLIDAIRNIRREFEVLALPPPTELHVSPKVGERLQLELAHMSSRLKKPPQPPIRIHGILVWWDAPEAGLLDL